MAGKDLKKSLKVGALIFLFIVAGMLSSIISSVHTGTTAPEHTAAADTEHSNK